MRLRALIAEDERLARDELEYLLIQEDVEIVAAVNNGHDVLQLYREYGADVIFLDIEMPEMDGRETAKVLVKESVPPYIIFTTAYEEYAVEAFTYRAIDYLLKPYDDTRLRESLDRVRKALANERYSRERQLYETRADKGKRTNLLLEEGDKLIVVRTDTILYAVKEERFVVVHTKDRTIQTKLALTELEERLTGHEFIRSHRSYLVNLQHVKEVESWFNGTYNLVLNGSGTAKVPVSRSMAKDVLKRLQL